MSEIGEISEVTCQLQLAFQYKLNIYIVCDDRTVETYKLGLKNFRKKEDKTYRNFNLSTMLDAKVSIFDTST